MKIAMDELVKRLGNPGKCQLFLYVLLGLNYFPVVTNHLLMAVLGSKIPFHCDEDRSNGYSMANITSQSQNTCEVPSKGTHNGTTNQTQDCTTGWVYDTSEVTIVTEWDLVCQHKHLVSLSTTVYFCGVMLGGLIFGFLSDYFGRKPFILFTLYSNFAVGIGMFFVPSYAVFTSLRFVQGALMQGLQTTSYAMVMELFSPAHRAYVGAALELFWGCSYIILALIWYLIQDWRYIQLAITLPSALTITYIWLLPESFRWLLLKNKFQAADNVINRIVKWNKIPYPEDSVTLVKSQIKAMSDNHTVSYTVVDLFKTPVIRRRSLILFYNWFATALGYYGLSLSFTQLAGNKFLIFFISGVVELPAYMASIYILNRFGRRKPMAGFFILCGITCIGAGMIHSKDASLQNLSLALSLIGKFSTAGLFSVVFLYTAELYPTVIRNVGCGACAFWMRAAGVAAPQILRLGFVTFKQLPTIIFGGVALVGGALTLTLSETLNKKLPDKIEDVEDVADLEMEEVKASSERGDAGMPLKVSPDHEVDSNGI
ncbi:organic cation transporter protein-like [Liolophura sinensis]|uniref:organic cation transporter protein-like n=1 Tax=Liolophura sinensis TaxID=3198878 RepID=UPI0031585081